jgi:hypothetical protein
MTEAGNENILGRPSKQRKIGPKKFKKKNHNALQQQDHIHLLRFLVTKQCHWIPWNEFFNNESKCPILFPCPDGGRCCDNCQPEDFLYDTIEIEGGAPRFSKHEMKSSDELHVAIVKQLKDLRRSISKRDFAKGSILVTGKT